MTESNEKPDAMTESNEKPDARGRSSVTKSERDRRTPDRTSKEIPGGAEGGDESPSANRLPGLPADDGTPLGDTDQHSS
jgi:hypothetical protein